jgi:hypothetical protein
MISMARIMPATDGIFRAAVRETPLRRRKLEMNPPRMPPTKPVDQKPRDEEVGQGVDGIFAPCLKRWMLPLSRRGCAGGRTGT